MCALADQPSWYQENVLTEPHLQAQADQHCREISQIWAATLSKFSRVIFYATFAHENISPGK